MKEDSHLDKLKKELQDWKKETQRQAVLNLSRFTYQNRVIKGRNYPKLLKSVKATYRLHLGVLELLSLKFGYQAYFVEFGTRKGVKKGSAKAKPRPWIEVTMNEIQHDAADLLAINLADAAVESIEFSQSTILNTTQNGK